MHRLTSLSGILHSLVIIVLCLGATGANSQETLFQQLKNMPDLRLVLTTDWDTLHASKDEDYQDATLEINGETWEVEVRLRGVYRRRFCDFPPFQINFKNKHLDSAGYYGDFDKFKVVTHCINEDEGQENQYEEKLIYDLYGLITNESFQVVDAGITYQYPDHVKPATTARALILEPNEEIAHRLEGEESEQYNVPFDSLLGANYNRVAMFQFMVGNYDWDHGVLRNVKLISGESGYRLVPYDFDFSAIVSPSYARMSGDYPLKDFRDRIYLGKHFFNELPATVNEFLALKEPMLDYVKSYPHLRKSRCREIMVYLKRFFKLLEDKDTELSHGYILRHL